MYSITQQSNCTQAVQYKLFLFTVQNASIEMHMPRLCSFNLFHTQLLCRYKNIPFDSILSISFNRNYEDFIRYVQVMMGQSIEWRQHISNLPRLDCFTFVRMSRLHGQILHSPSHFLLSRAIIRFYQMDHYYQKKYTEHE